MAFFFGAGNLIFPLHMGQEAGKSIIGANFGFLITGIGIPLLGIIAIGLSDTDGVFGISKRVGHGFAYFFTVALYFVIGPFFALPRLASTSFEIGVSPLLSKNMQSPALAIYSLLFFGLAWYLSKKPGKLIDYIGKYLNPMFLGLLAVLLVIAFLHPLGQINQFNSQSAYEKSPILTGFIQGYNTLDALAALAFGVIIVNTLKLKNIETKAAIAKETCKSGVITIIMMGIIYTLLSLLGTLSLGKFAISDNGGIALAQLSHYYLGDAGSILLAGIIILACLKTAIGLITAFSETFVELFPSKSYLFLSP
ncbi:branched-chain amino acid transport system II carrier protein [Streptococcus urinalis FB127-CNA-2]|uniref:Branched-chain amino acid transport system carrier protein n=1 Tax=Streptococcus urinalis 2285-97 TaxID=764291 RepID=G5KHV5_9STRE|nr:putative branched-chain amino acid transport system II carrier protein [Streptococcus urinalis 2285-97]EKS22623.1 branched-chain amino acid transport system II carrier protein [Streptococcus urinalis FB127-CNA-2]VEF32392.1 branched-chain amino acid transporter [Streptococcus urinalis]